MDNEISEINELIQQFSKLPGLGPKSAKRIILKLINNKDNAILSRKLVTLKNDVPVESHSYYVKYAPAFLFIILPLIAARPCFERNLKSAGIIGISFTLFLIVASITS